MVKIIAGHSSKKLASNLSSNLNIDYINVQVGRFSSQEFNILFEKNLENENVIIVQSTGGSAHDNLMELMLLADAAKNPGARYITAVIPYLNYSRQNKAFYNLGPSSVRLIAKLLETSGINNLITLDLHSEEIKKFFKIKVQNIDPIPIFINEIKNLQNLIIVSPDKGSCIKAQRLAKILGGASINLNKRRSLNGISYENNLIDEIKGKNCFIIDDVIDTGETLSKAALLLKQNGDADIYAFATHLVLAKQAELRLISTPASVIRVKKNNQDFA